MQAHGLDPVHAIAWTNLAKNYLKLNEPESALFASERACALSDGYVPALLSRSNALKELQRWGDAQAVLLRSAPCAPGNAHVQWAMGNGQWALAMLQLVQDDYRHGLVNFEARWEGAPESARVPVCAFPQENRWRGESLSGKTLVVWREQGHGDVFQLVRFLFDTAERVRRDGGTLIYRCYRNLLDSPWYPSLELYRQHGYADWSNVLDDAPRSCTSRGSETK